MFLNTHNSTVNYNYEDSLRTGQPNQTGAVSV